MSKRWTFCVCLLLCLALRTGARAQNKAQTLGEVVAAQHIPVDEASLPNLDKRITSAAELNESGEFVIAYYVHDATNRLFPPMYVDRYDKNGGKWQSGKIDEAATEAKNVDTPCLGSVLGMHRFGDYLLVDTHINPSAGCTLILDRKLELKGGLFGWYLAGLGKSGILYHRSGIHFAAVHSAEISLYDLATGNDTTIFPPKLDPVIRAQIAKKISEFGAAHQDWCQEHNDPCAPDEIESALIGDIAVNAESDALAFVTSYENGNATEGVRKPDGPKEVVYVYRHVSDPAKREFREKLLDDAKREFQVKDVRLLLEAGTMKKMFE
jgi:hypothetical protein